MNLPQRIVLVVTALALLGALLFPPFNLQGQGGVVVNLGYAWVLSPPQRVATVDEAMLLAEWAGIAAVAAALYFAFRTRRSRPSGLRPTQWELQAMVTHVAYEAAALEATAGQYLSGQSPRQAFEAFLLHARQLREFYRKKWNPADRHACSVLLAEHYFATPRTWHAARGPEPAILRETKDSIDKQLAHISRFRANPGFTTDLEAKAPDILAALKDQCDRFQQSLSSTPYGAAFRSDLASWKAKL